MEMSTGAALVSVEDYLRMTEKPNRDYREGVVTAKPMPTKLPPSFSERWYPSFSNKEQILPLN